MNKKRILITGSSGYMGGLIMKRLSFREDVEEIFALDKDDGQIKDLGPVKVNFLKFNTSDHSWQKTLENENIDTVIHCAWQIREMYGKRDVQWKWNIDGSDMVFDFAFKKETVKKLIHFSTVASYGAFSKNTFDQKFTEESPLRDLDYLYAKEKKISEEHLLNKFENKKFKNSFVPTVFIFRPASITGPAFYTHKKGHGLQSALSGKKKGNGLIDLIYSSLKFIPTTSKWCRQFVHEEDVISATEKAIFLNDDAESRFIGKVNIYNLCPSGKIIQAKDMAEIMAKKSIKFPVWCIRVIFFLAWHLTRGKISTATGSWRSYCYPIVVDGSKVTRELGLVYCGDSRKALISSFNMDRFNEM